MISLYALIMYKLFGCKSKIQKLKDIWVTFSETDPDIEISEPSINGYARQLATDWIIQNKLFYNANVIEFNITEENWGILCYVVLMDAEKDGNLIGSGLLSHAVFIGGGDNVIISKKELTFCNPMLLHQIKQ